MGAMVLSQTRGRPVLGIALHLNVPERGGGGVREIKLIVCWVLRGNNLHIQIYSLIWGLICILICILEGFNMHTRGV